MIKKLLLLVFLVVGALGVSAQTISGTVTDLNGSVIANQQVYISNYDSTNNYSSQTFTNNLGIYTFSNVPASAMGFSVYTKDCQNQISAINVYTNSGTANFTICTTTITCSAAFYSNPDSNIVNAINFIDNSTGNPTSWYWVFGDGSTSNLQNPSHTYTSSGSYSVFLFIYSANCSDSIYTNVIVANSTVSCAASFNSTPDSNNVNTINFTDNSTGNPTSWLWNFGDGTTSSLQNPSHTYANSGTYGVLLFISSANCTDSIYTNIIVANSTVSCAASFYSTPDSNNVNTIFTDNSTGNPSSWAWDFGDGSTSNLQNPIHAYAYNGSYTVTLNISGNNCSSTTTSIVIVSNSAPAGFVLTGQIFTNGTYLNTATVELYDATTNVLLDTIQVDTIGMYYFTNIYAGNYIIRAHANVVQGFVTTYYGDVVLWSTATPINLVASIYNLDINLASLVIVPGTNSVSGTVGLGNKASVDDLKVYLMDANNSSVVASTFTNTNGEYNFDNILDGSYNIWVEVIGKLSTPISITVDGNNTNSSNNNFTIGANAIFPSTVSVENNNSIEGSISLYPNPVVDILNINLELQNESTINLEVYSISGRLISTQNFNVISGKSVVKVNVKSLAQGTYFVLIKDDVNRMMHKIFVK